MSRSAGVPTGWEVQLDLVRKLAAAAGTSAEPDPEAWYVETFGQKPTYSGLLEAVAKSSAERMQILRAYFEPTPEEREQGLKVPTPAHRAVAKFVEKGFVRVVVTTNFDRLLESALTEIGIQPVVISTPDGAAGALPLVHSRCTVIKINGDYLDIRLKNTVEELTSYEPSLRRLLDQVFDEYGIVVCGWSGDWDVALRNVWEGAPNRRFTTYWATFGELSETAQSLVHLRAAIAVSTKGADEFFQDLEEKLQALTDLTVNDSVSPKVAVARMKRYLADPTGYIALADMLSAEVERVHSTFAAPRFSSSAPWQGPEDARERIRSYEVALGTFLPLAICGAYWGEAAQDALLVTSFQRFADRDKPNSYTDIWMHLASYPALVLLYGMGLAALARSKYDFLKLLLYAPVRTDRYKLPQAACVLITDDKILSRLHQRQIIASQHTPLSNHLHKVIRVPLLPYLPGDLQFEDAFDWFEYLLCLCHCDAKFTRTELMRNPPPRLWAPIGRFGWKQSYEGAPGIQAETELKPDSPIPEKVVRLVRAGFFESAGGDLGKYRALKAGLDRHVATVRDQWDVF